MPRGPRLPRALFTCPVCGRQRTVLGSKLVDYPSRPAMKYCSLACRGVAMRNMTMMRCDACGQFVRRRHGNYMRKRFCSKGCEVRSRESRGWLDKHGYRVLRIRGRDTPEHRIIMERVVGRPLLPYETVHHINGRRDDNRPENLELWLGRHTPGQRLAEFMAFAVTVLTDHGYHVTPPPS